MNWVPAPGGELAPCDEVARGSAPVSIPGARAVPLPMLLSCGLSRSPNALRKVHFLVQSINFYAREVAA